MKKKSVYKILYAISALLVVVFAIVSVVDTYKYNTGAYLGSAPLYLYILVNAIVYLLPSLTFFVAAIICKALSQQMVDKIRFIYVAILCQTQILTIPAYSKYAPLLKLTSFASCSYLKLIFA